jgi:hypothetical protein
LVTGNVLLLALMVLLFVGVVTVILVYHYSTASSATSVLGVVIPVASVVIGLGAGVGVGHASGQSAGRSQQQSQTASKLQQDVIPLLDKAVSAYGNVSGAVVTAGTSEPGKDTLDLTTAETTHEVKVADVRQVGESLAAVKSALTTLGA